MEATGLSGPPRLLEREGELAALERLIASTASSGGVLAFEGPPGIGKTRLIAETRTHARDAGLRVLAARGTELEQEFSYGAARQLLEPVVASATPEERAELLTGAAALAAPLFDPAQLAAGPAEDSSLAMLHGLFWLTANLAARQPLLLAVDDLHWCDVASVRWLAYLIPRMEGLPLAIAVGFRPAEPGADSHLLGQIVTDPLATVVRPAPLTEEAADMILRDSLGREPQPAFSRACHLESGGNPLLLRELAGAIAFEGIVPEAANVGRLRELGGEAVSRSVARRLARLPADASRLARAVAILGDGIDLRHAAELAGVDEAAASEALTVLAATDVLTSRSPFSFVHPVVRAAVYAQLTPVERDEGHARAARLLAASGADPERVAAQLLATNPAGDDRAVEVLREAATRSLARGAPESAVAYLRRALAEPPPDDVRRKLLLELGAAAQLVDVAEAAEHLNEALRLAEDPVEAAQTAELLGWSLFYMGRPQETVDACLQALADLPDDQLDLRQRLEAEIFNATMLERSLHHVTQEMLPRLRARPPDDTLGGRMLQAYVASVDLNAGVHADELVTRALEALAGGTLVKGANSHAAIAVVEHLLLTADAEEAFDLFQAALTEAHARGSVLRLCLDTAFRSLAHLQRGSLADAQADAEESLRAADIVGLHLARPFAATQLADVHAERGDLEAASAALARSLLPEPPPTHSGMLLYYLDARGRLLLRRGRTQEALAALREVGDLAAAVGMRNPAYVAWRTAAACALAELGEHEEARELAAEEIELAREFGSPRPLGRALRRASLVDDEAGRIELLGEAVAVLETSSARLELAKSLVELGAAMRRQGNRAAARDPLRRGLELATICDATRVAERAESELLATGARPRRVALSGVDSLTPSERRVAVMAAEGMSNREVAQALFVTLRTVEMHLSNAFRKLGISSRTQLAAALAE